MLPEFPKTTNQVVQDLTEWGALRQFLVGHFSLGELKNLAFDLGVDFELFSHQSKGDFSREFVAHLEHRNGLACLVAELLKLRNDDDSVELLTSLLSKLPTCTRNWKVQIIASEDLLKDVSGLLGDMAAKLGINRDDVILVAVAGGSVHLLVSLPETVASSQVQSEIRGLVEGKYQTVSTVTFDSLDPISQKAWRWVACDRPPVREGNILNPTVSWADALEQATKMAHSYFPHLFVDREEEIDYVMSRVRSLIAGHRVSRTERIIHCPGLTGFGKTWLLCHLRHLITQEPQAIALHVRLGQGWVSADYESPAYEYEEATRKLLMTLHKELCLASGTDFKRVDLPDSTLYQISAELDKTVQGLQGQRVVALLVDELNDAPPPWLSLLENHLLAPLVLKHSHILLVMAGRNLNYNWDVPALRPPPDNPLRLKPFHQEDTRRQIELQFPWANALVEPIHAIANGAPGGNSFVASWAGQPPTVPDSAQALAQYNKILMKDIPSDLHWCLYALCVSRGFQAELLEHLLPIADSTSGPWSFPACQDLIRQLVAKGLVRVVQRPQEYRYEMDSYLRAQLEAELEEQKPKLWRQLHCTLFRLYAFWARDPKSLNTAPHWQDESNYHAQRLRGADYDPDQCIGKLAELRQNLVDYFSESELHDLCFDLGIDYTNLAGLSKGDKARELVEYMNRRERVVELVKRCRHLRPTVIW